MTFTFCYAPFLAIVTVRLRELKMNKFRLIWQLLWSSWKFFEKIWFNTFIRQSLYISSKIHLPIFQKFKICLFFLSFDNFVSCFWSAPTWLSAVVTICTIFLRINCTFLSLHKYLFKYLFPLQKIVNTTNDLIFTSTFNTMKNIIRVVQKVEKITDCS